MMRSGRVLFFMNRPFNDQLVKGIPQLLTEIRAVAPRDPPIVLVFDRGGYSGPLFRALTREGIGFITYLKGRAARRRFPARHFRRRWWHVEDPATIQRPRRVVYRIHEKRTRIRGAGLVRTLSGRRRGRAGASPDQLPDDGRREGRASPQDALAARKQLQVFVGHYGVEQLIQHDATWHRDDRLLANPRRAQVRQQITALQTDIVLIEAELGREDGPVEPGTRRRLTRELATLEDRLARLTQRLARTPATVPAATLTGSTTRATLNTDRRNVVNAIKIATYNAERLLARHFFRHYKDPRDWLTVFRAVLHLPGSVRRHGDHVRVTLRAPDLPRVRRALSAMLDDINSTDATSIRDRADLGDSNLPNDLNSEPHNPPSVKGVLRLASSACAATHGIVWFVSAGW